MPRTEATFVELLRRFPTWDRRAQRAYDAHGEALVDASLQNRAELAALLAFMEAHDVRSYLEIGTWTGGTVRIVDALLDLDMLAACDHGWAEQNGLPINLPARCRFFRGNSDSAAFLAWREALGHVDLVLIDANHRYDAVKRDVALQMGFPHRFLALHDITGATRGTEGVAQLWGELSGQRWEFVRDNPDLDGAPSRMGIGVWGTSRDG